jgi:predicted O-methyltransferase YrrM
VWRRDYPGLGEDVIRDFEANYGWVMPVSLLALLDQLARELRPGVVLEIGSGLSTRVLQRALAGTGALLVSVDDDPAWLPPADSESLRMLGVTPDRPDVLRAALDSTVSVDLVVVDGPANRDRFDADRLELYSQLAAADAVWVIDDTDRPENDVAASRIAAERGLERSDHGDPLYRGHQYSVLAPAGTPIRGA